MLIALLLTSITLQFVAAGLALRLIRRTGHTLAWSLISAALLLMAIRRSGTLVKSLASDSIIIDPFAESVALLISCLMVAGVWLIGGLFVQLNTLRENTQRELDKRIETEKELKQQEILLKEMERIAHIGGWDFDPETGEGNWTDEVARIHDLETKDSATMQIGVSYYHGESRTKIEQAIKEAIEAGKPYDLELELTSAKGVQKSVRTIGSPILENGKVVRVRGSFQDITEKKKQDEELRKYREHLEVLVETRALELADLNRLSTTILDTTPVGIITYRSDGQCLSANQHSAELVGATREQLLKQNFNQIESWRASGLLDAAHRCLETGERQDTSARVTTTFGKCVVVEARFAHFLVREDPHLLMTFTDVTERVRAEEELKASSQKLAAANLELEAFSYSVSHDLRAPLRSMDGFSEALIEDYADVLDEDGLAHLHRIRAAAQRMGELIEDLLKLSRISRWEMNRQTINLGTIAHEVLATLHAQQPERVIEAEINNTLQVNADPRLMRLVIENLIGNAWKFSQTREIARIEVNCFKNAELESPHPGLADDVTVFIVRDNGVGFDMTYADKLFGAFQRLHTVDKFEGSGIGLATVKRAIRRQGGLIWATGHLNEGATFCFSLTD